MLGDFILADKNSKTPMYRQIYLSIRRAIENGSLKKDTKLPSIRKLSAQLGISKTTVTGAYDQLCVEGYIKNKPQSGYYVAAQFENAPKAADKTAKAESRNRFFAYDFSGKSIDDKIIDLAEWKKCVKDVVNRNYLLTSYGDAQGEEALRTALQKYALGTRSVNAQSHSIVVGAGTQAILYLLCSVLGCGKTVAVERTSFVQSEYIFRSFNYRITYFDCDEHGVTIDSLEKNKPDLVLINPNFTGTAGACMPVTRRLEVIEWVRKNNALILEDDYNGELRYSTHPIPCVQNYDTENTVYIGSFSKVLLPSVRISYTVLPDSLLRKYEGVKRLMNQTASKTEQLALAKYIESRKIEAHLRRARRVYLEKSKTLLENIESSFENAHLTFNETSLYISFRLPYAIERKNIDKMLADRSVRLMPNHNADNEFALSFSGIAQEKIADGVAILREVIEANTKTI